MIHLIKFSIYVFVLVIVTAFVAGQLPEKNIISGHASYYGAEFHGKRTANGETYNRYLFTAAHRSFPFNSYVRVTNSITNLSITVRINDRGPFNYSRIIDLSESAARRIGSYKHGITPVTIQEVNLIRLTPEIDSIFTGNDVLDCLGNADELSNRSLSLYRTSDLLHIIYLANELYLHDDVDKVYISGKGSGKNRIYHLVISGYSNEQELKSAKDYFEKKGFMQVIEFK
jgi:hypothetical protein